MRLKRIFAIAEKETFHILRDPFTLAMALLLPVMMVVLFGVCIEFNVKNALGGACGEELFSDDGGVYVDDARSFVTPGQELLAAVRTENYRVVHTDNIEGPATMVLDQNAIVRD